MLFKRFINKDMYSQSAICSFNNKFNVSCGSLLQVKTEVSEQLLLLYH